MSNVIKEIEVQGERVQFLKSGFIDGVNAAQVQFVGPDGWGVTCNVALTEVENLSVNDKYLNDFVQKAKAKLGLSDIPVFTRGELKVLRALDINLTNEDMAERLCLSSYTIKSHLYQIFKKANVRNRRELLGYLNAHREIVTNARMH